MSKKIGDVLQTEHRKTNVKVIISRVEPFILDEIAHVILPKKRYLYWLVNELQKLKNHNKQTTSKFGKDARKRGCGSRSL